MNTDAPNLWTFLIALVGSLSTVITALATYRRTARQDTTLDDQTAKLNEIHTEVNGKNAVLASTNDDLAQRLSVHEPLPEYLLRRDDEGNPESGGGDRGGSDASGPSGQLGGNEKPV